MKPWLTSCVNARLWPHADMRTWLGSFFLEPGDIVNLNLGGHLELQQGCRAPMIKYGAQRACRI